MEISQFYWIDYMGNRIVSPCILVEFPRSQFVLLPDQVAQKVLIEKGKV